MIEKIYDLFKRENQNEKLDDMPVEKKELQERRKASVIGSVYGKTSLGSDIHVTFGSAEEERRRKLMSVNMDPIVRGIKTEKTKQPLLGRTVNNIVKGALKDGYYFTSEYNQVSAEKIQQVMDRFNDILYESSYEPRQFLRELLINQVSYSNSFLLPKRNTDKSTGEAGTLERVIIIQNEGWSVTEAIGTTRASAWVFAPGQISEYNSKGTSKKYKSKDVWHYTFNKESDEIFGVPLWCAVIPFIKHYNLLLSKSIGSYNDQAIERNIYVVGGSGSKGANGRFVTPQEFEDVKAALAYADDGEDVIVPTQMDVKTISKKFTSPEKLMEKMELQIIAGLHTSSSQLGSNGAGRQDAETQQEGTNTTIEDFQENIEDWINKTFIREICLDLFGSYNSENKVKFKFRQSFDEQERKEKHAAYLFQAGVTDLNETRESVGRGSKPISDKDTYFKLYQETEMDGTVSSSNSPTNQHTGSSGTGTTKKTKKD